MKPNKNDLEKIHTFNIKNKKINFEVHLEKGADGYFSVIAKIEDKIFKGKIRFYDNPCRISPSIEFSNFGQPKQWPLLVEIADKKFFGDEDKSFAQHCEIFIPFKEFMILEKKIERLYLPEKFLESKNIVLTISHFGQIEQQQDFCSISELIDFLFEKGISLEDYYLDLLENKKTNFQNLEIISDESNNLGYLGARQYEIKIIS